MEFNVITEVFDRRYNKWVNGLIWFICALEIIVFLFNLWIEREFDFKILFPLIVLVPYAAGSKEKQYLLDVPCRFDLNDNNLILTMNGVIVDNKERYNRQYQFDIDSLQYSTVPNANRIVLTGKGFVRVAGESSGKTLYEGNFDNEVVELKLSDTSLPSVEEYLNSAIPGRLMHRAEPESE